jgi:hypothetical protein
MKIKDGIIRDSLQKGKFLQFGSDDITKDQDAGKVGYKTLSVDSLDIIGAGEPNSKRKVKIWDALTTDSISANNIVSSSLLKSNGNIEASKSMSTLLTPGWIGPYQLNLYSLNNQCIDTSQFSGNLKGIDVCDDKNDNQKFYFNVVTGQIRNSDSKCLQRGPQWTFATCNKNADQQFDRVEHGIKWRDETCLDTGNTNRASVCNSDSINQRISLSYIG